MGMTTKVNKKASIMCIIALCLSFLFGQEVTGKELWKITAYCSCKLCCNKSDGITASGYKARYGYCAVNWLPFGTKIKIVGLGEFIVMDRGSKSQFGSKENKVRHIDIWIPTHKQAKEFGVKWKEVMILP